MPPKSKKGKKGAKDAWNSDDDKEFDLASTPQPASDADEGVPAAKSNQKKNKKAAAQVVDALAMLNTGEEGAEPDEEAVAVAAPAAAKKGGKGSRKPKGGDSDDDADAKEEDVKSKGRKKGKGAVESDEEVERDTGKKGREANRKGKGKNVSDNEEESPVASPVISKKGGKKDKKKKAGLDSDEEASPESAAPATAKKKEKKKKGKRGVESEGDDDKFDLKVQDAEDEDDLGSASLQRQKGGKAKKATPPKNAFDLLGDEDEDEEVKAVGGKFDGLELGQEDAEDEGQAPKKKKEKREKDGKQKDKSKDTESIETEEADGKAEADGKKKNREKRDKDAKKKEKAALKAAKKEAMLADSDKEEETPSSFDATTSRPAAYGYASGQPLGAEGTNPIEAIAVTGNLLSPPNSRDLQVDKVTIQAYGKTLLKDSELSLINGRRYGLIAPNGSGKSTLLHAIACGLVPAPRSLDYYLLDREFRASDLTSVEAVLDIIVTEREHLETQMENLYSDPEKNAVQLDYIQQRLQELEEQGGERRAKDILRGLGFSEKLMETKTKDLSGGWRMRISLARVLFVKPTLMMLDEPTNHLDLEAVVWLEDYLTHNLEGHTLIMTSHSQDTLNEICTDIIHLYHQHLDYYSGNYDTFVKVRSEKDKLLQKRARAQEKQMAKVKDALGKTGSKQQAQAKNKVKAMEKRSEKEKEKDKTLQEEIIQEKDLVIRFEPCGGGIPPPALKFRDVSFAYPGKEPIFQNLNFGIDLTSRIALVGPNGAGKTTLLNLMLGNLEPTGGSITKHHHLRLAHFHQHMGDQLDLSKSACEWLRDQFPDGAVRSEHDMRQFVGRYGLTGKSQVIPMRQLSDGQRRRVIFAYLGLRNPHLILMDEPTNALDLDTIDALADAINEFDGGVVLISHDFRLIDQVAQEVWIVDGGEVEEFDGDIRDYKARLKEKVQAEREASEQAEAARKA
ncbi:hypothetical protein HK104_000811 [Borealophlyctis nickersoniae]|nr:hypothetical protein HK104_000811 [Borealophlyctis nickersoniae]